MEASVTVTMHAPAAAVWDLVSDVTRIGEFSPETLQAEWLGDAHGPKLGAEFRGQVKRNGRGPLYWTTCRVTMCEPERDFGFAVLAAGRPVNNWRYHLEASADGSTTEVTESFHLEPSIFMKGYIMMFGASRTKTNERNMLQTLERIKAVVEA